MFSQIFKVDYVLPSDNFIKKVRKNNIFGCKSSINGLLSMNMVIYLMVFVCFCFPFSCNSMDSCFESFSYCAYCMVVSP